jgi:hypothetical protein
VISPQGSGLARRYIVPNETERELSSCLIVICLPTPGACESQVKGRQGDPCRLAIDYRWCGGTRRLLCGGSRGGLEMKRPMWLGDSRATKSDKLKKARQQTDQRMNVQKQQLDETEKKNAPSAHRRPK